jgi:nucleotide-binding universal stress UspA family protein
VKVLIAMDSSDASQHVLAEAAVRPWPVDTAFAVINVVDVYGLTRLPGLVEEGRRLGLALVNAASSKLSQAGYKASAEVLLGTPRREIAEYTKRWSADLVMVGSHGQGAIARFLMGSVAQGVLHTAPCSVEVVRASASSAVPSSRAMKILLATDGSEFSIAAVKSVVSRPWPAGSEIRLLSVEEMPAVLPKPNDRVFSECHVSREPAGRALGVRPHARQRGGRQRANNPSWIEFTSAGQPRKSAWRCTRTHPGRSQGMESRSDRVGVARAAGIGPHVDGQRFGERRAARAVLGGSDSTSVSLTFGASRWS